MKILRELFYGLSPLAIAVHGLKTPAFWLALAGVIASWFLYLKSPDLPEKIKTALKPIHTVLENKYYFDKFNEAVLARGAHLLGQGLWKGGDAGVIDGLIVKGSVIVVHGLSRLIRAFQSGHIYLYAFTMIFGFSALLTLWWLFWSGPAMSWSWPFIR